LNHTDVSCVQFEFFQIYLSVGRGMNSSAYIIQLLATAIFLIVGIRLLALTWRTRRTSEFFLATYITLTGVSYSIYFLNEATNLGEWSRFWGLGARVIYDAGVVPFLFFIRRTYRPTEIWAGGMIWGCTSALVIGVSMSAFIGDWYGRLQNPWFILEWAGYTVTCVWMSAEAFRSYSNASRRARIGLCDRSVANGTLLWCAFGGFQTLACVSVILVGLDYAVYQITSIWGDALLGGFETVAVMAVWIALCPPQILRRWFEVPESCPPLGTDR
jgi:hypothetical protein